jgi:hypothetical protein
MIFFYQIHNFTSFCFLSVDWTPPTPGQYKVSTKIIVFICKNKNFFQTFFLTLCLQVNVKYAGQDVPSSPFRVPVKPHVDVSKVKVDGLEPSKL